MTLLIRLRFAGRLDRPLFELALQLAVSRQPLLNAHVRQRRGKRFDWVAAEPRPPVLSWRTGRAENSYPRCTPIDLSTETGLRTLVVESDDSTDLVFQVHHACCDGIGAFGVVSDLLVAYAAMWQQPTNPPVIGAETLRPLEERLLLGRGAFGLTAWRFLRVAPQQMTGLIGARQFFAHAPAPLIADGAQPDEAPLPERFPTVLGAELDPSELDALRAVARRQDATINDVLLRDLFLTLDQWRARQSTAVERDWLRVSVPLSLRLADDERLPAANVVSMVFMDRRADDFGEDHDLLRGIHDEIQLIRRRRLGLTLVLTLKVVRALTGSIARVMPTDDCSATCVLSNLGSPLAGLPLPERDGRLVVGNTVLEDVEVLAPLRPRTSAAFCVATYANRLRISLHYDSRSMTVVAAEDLLATFMRSVARSLGDSDIA